MINDASHARSTFEVLTSITISISNLNFLDACFCYWRSNGFMMHPRRAALLLLLVKGNHAVRTPVWAELKGACYGQASFD